MAPQFPADLGQVVRQALGLEVLRDGVHREALGNGAEIERHAAGLQCAAAFGVQLDSAPAALQPCLRDLIVRRRRTAPWRGTKAPQVHQRAGAGVVGAAAVALLGHPGP